MPTISYPIWIIIIMIHCCNQLFRPWLRKNEKIATISMICIFLNERIFVNTAIEEIDGAAFLGFLSKGLGSLANIIQQIKTINTKIPKISEVPRQLPVNWITQVGETARLTARPIIGAGAATWLASGRRWIWPRWSRHQMAACPRRRQRRRRQHRRRRRQMVIGSHYEGT